MGRTGAAGGGEAVGDLIKPRAAATEVAGGLEAVLSPLPLSLSPSIAARLASADENHRLA